MFFGVLTVVKHKMFFIHHYDFLYKVYKSMANTNSKQHVLFKN